jgi:hypothetical protein
MALSKRAKARLKLGTASDRKKVLSAAKTLFEAELMGTKRVQEIERYVKRC